MKNNSIFARFFKSFLMITSVFLIVIGVFFNQYINNYFREESYKMLESSQSANSLILKNLFYSAEKYEYFIDKKLNNKPRNVNKKELQKQMQNGLKNNSIKVVQKKVEGLAIERRAITQNFLIVGKNEELIFLDSIQMNNFEIEAKLRKIIEEDQYLDIEKKQSVEINGKQRLYLIGEVLMDDRTISKIKNSKGQNIEIEEIYVISSMWESYSNDMSRDFLERYIVLALMFLFLVVSLTGYFSRYMLIKFKRLENTLKKVGRREWDESVIIEDSYELGRLSKSIDDMRCRLKEYDEEQKNQFHIISHELKTPIMIIKGYLESILNGLYPKGNLNNSLGVVYQETDKMENMVKNILYLNKMDYLRKHYQIDSSVDLKKVIEVAVDRFENIRPDIEWNLNMESSNYVGTEEQWELILDNILSNQVRYAKTFIGIKLTNEELIIENDGELIAKESIDKVFEPFFKGSGGQTGLGLSIVKKLLEINNYRVSVKNDFNKVVFMINKMDK